MGYIGKVKDTAGSTHLVGSTLYGTCSTATATAAKVVTCSDYVEEVEGVTIHVHFTNKNTAACTLNVNNKGAHTCIGASDIPGTWEDDSVASFTLVQISNTLYWYQNNLYWENTNTDTKVTQTATTTNSEYPILFKNAASQTNETAGVRFGNTTNKIPKINPSTGNISGATINNVLISSSSGDMLFSTSFQSLKVDHVTVSSSNYVQFELHDSNDTETDLFVPVGSSYTLGAACEKDVVPGLSSSMVSDDLPTATAVVNYVNAEIHAAVSGAAKLQGTLVQTDSGSSSTKWTQAELEAASYKSGWYWVVEAAGTYAGNVMEVGDMLFCVSDKSGSTYAAADFAAIQNNIETLTNTEIDNLWANAVAVS